MFSDSPTPMDAIREDLEIQLIVAEMAYELALTDAAAFIRETMQMTPEERLSWSLSEEAKMTLSNKFTPLRMELDTVSYDRPFGVLTKFLRLMDPNSIKDPSNG